MFPAWEVCYCLCIWHGITVFQMSSSSTSPHKQVIIYDIALTHVKQDSRCQCSCYCTHCACPSDLHRSSLCSFCDLFTTGSTTLSHIAPFKHCNIIRVRLRLKNKNNIFSTGIQTLSFSFVLFPVLSWCLKSYGGRGLSVTSVRMRSIQCETCAFRLGFHARYID